MWEWCGRIMNLLKMVYYFGSCFGRRPFASVWSDRVHSPFSPSQTMPFGLRPFGRGCFCEEPVLEPDFFDEAVPSFHGMLLPSTAWGLGERTSSAWGLRERTSSAWGLGERTSTAYRVGERTSTAFRK